MSTQTNILLLGKGFIEAARTAIAAQAPDAQIIPGKTLDAQVSASFVNSAAFKGEVQDAIDFVVDGNEGAAHVSITDSNMTVPETLRRFSASEFGGDPRAAIVAAAGYFVELSGLNVEPEELVAAL
ncbi:MAG: hypothetical protein KDI46_05500 [Alphaproteobacteria bacterium]|nr:hypothetical protein [Alphaproteobacteria bacterium]